MTRPRALDQAKGHTDGVEETRSLYSSAEQPGRGPSPAAHLRRLPAWVRVALPIGGITTLTIAGAILGRGFAGSPEVRSTTIGPPARISDAPQPAPVGPDSLLTMLRSSIEVARTGSNAPAPPAPPAPPGPP